MQEIVNSNILQCRDILKDVSISLTNTLEIIRSPGAEQALNLHNIQDSLKNLNEIHQEIHFKLLQLASTCSLLTSKPTTANYQTNFESLVDDFEDTGVPKLITTRPDHADVVTTKEGSLEGGTKEEQNFSSNYREWNDDNIGDEEGGSGTKEEQNFSSNVEDPLFEKETSLNSWDTEFVKLRLLAPANEEELIEKCQRMSNLAENFFAAATTFARMVVAEQHCSSEEKVIKPLDVGGVAGGTKFGLHGLFFKYPVDSCIGKSSWLYGGLSCDDNRAAKASNHDLNGQTYCMMADDLKNFNFPLLALIDFQGFRLTVMTSLPVSSKTLVYGSDDGGHTIHTDPIVHEKLKLIAQKLNLRVHKASEKPTDMALCGDIEIHKFNNEKEENLFYCLDLARVFPPTFPEQGLPMGSIFFRMLRPEIIKKHNVALSSDALSNWQASDPEAHLMNQEIIAATKRVHEEVLIFANEISNEKVNAKYIQTAFSDAYHPSYSGIPTKDAIIRDLHRRGINTRYLGLLVISMKQQNPDMINFLISLMMTRVIKNRWRNKIRKVKGKKERIHETCLNITEKLIRSVLTIITDKQEQKGWKKLLLQMFGAGIIPTSKHEHLIDIYNDAINRKAISIWWVIIRFCELCGILLNPACLQCLIGGISFQFSREDIVGYIPLMKFSPILDYFSGLNYLLKARKEEKFGSRLILTKGAAKRLANAINYDFPNVRLSYAEAQFETIKFDRNFIGDWDEIEYQYRVQWQEKKSQSQITKEYLDYIYVLLWQLFIQPLQEEMKNEEISINLSKNTFVGNLWDCLYGTKKEQVACITNNYYQSLKIIDNHFIKLKNQNENYSSLPHLLQDMEPEMCIKLLKESMDWDIDKHNKWWFFARYFSFSELVKFCHRKNLKDLIYQKEFLLSPYPHIIAVFYYGCPEINHALDDLEVPHKDYFDLILKKPYENGKTLLNSAIEKRASDVVDYLLSRGALEFITNQAISCTSEIEVTNCIKKNHPCNVQLKSLNLSEIDKDVSLAEYASHIGVLIILSTDLKELTINSSQRLHPMGPTVAHSIVMLSALNINTCLTLLDLTSNELGIEGAESIATALRTNSSLISLNLCGNAIGKLGAMALASALHSNVTLSSLNICKNSIGTEGAIAIATTLNKNSVLSSLNIGSNEIGQEGAKAIAAVLHLNSTLTSLDINDNGIGSEGLAALSTALHFNSTLSTLNLLWNKIGNEGVQALATTLYSNSTLTSIDLCMNLIYNEGAAPLATVLQYNTTLTLLNLNSNFIAHDVQDAIISIVDFNAKAKATGNDTQQRNKLINDLLTKIFPSFVSPLPPSILGGPVEPATFQTFKTLSLSLSDFDL